MTAADTSSWIAFLEGSTGEDVRLLDRALEDRQVVMVPVVLTELLSDASLPSNVVKAISDLPLLEITSGYWRRAGVLRAKVLATRQSASRRRPHRPELYRPKHTSDHARPGLPRVRHGGKTQPGTWPRRIPAIISSLEEQILTHVLSASYGSPVPHLFDPPIAGPLLRRKKILCP